MIRYALLICVLASVLLAGQSTSIDYINLAVEKEVFIEGPPGRYATTGKFGGIGWLYLSVRRKVIEFKGLSASELPVLGQDADDKFRFVHEAFTLQSVIPIGAGEYAFQAVNNGPFARTVTGRMRIRVTSGVWGRVEEFLMEEHGQFIKGVMDRYTLPTSPESKAMLERNSEVFFGGNFVALDPDLER